MENKNNKMKLRRVFALITVFLVCIFLSNNVLAASHSEKLVAFENAVLSGDFSTQNLKLTGHGTVLSGNDVKIPLLGQSYTVLVSNLEVNGQKVPLSFDAESYYFVWDKGEFGFTADVKLKLKGESALFVPGPLNSLQLDLQNAFVKGGDIRYGIINETITIKQKSTEEGELLVSGMFRFSYADINKSFYRLNFKTSGPSVGKYELNLLNNEKILEVKGANWKIGGGTLILEIPYNDATVDIVGLFNTVTPQIPLIENRHKVIIESEAEKKLGIETDAEEIDITEAGIAATYPDARAFLASRSNHFKTTITDLTILPSLAATARSANNVFAINSKGSILGEVSYDYSNNGLEYLRVYLNGTPLYASTGSTPIKLTDDEGLFLPLPKGQNNFDLVYFDTRGSIKPVDLISIPIAKTDLPITTETTTIYLPRNVIILETFGVPGGSELPLSKIVLLFGILVSGGAYLLIRNKKFVVYYLITFLGLILFDSRIAALFFALTIGLIAKRYLAFAKWRSIGAVALGIIALIIIVSAMSGLVGDVMRFSSFAMAYEGGGGGGASQGSAMMAPQAQLSIATNIQENLKPTLAKIGTVEEGAIEVPVKKGVYPVKFEIPPLGKRIVVTNYMVTKENPTDLTVLVVADWIRYLIYLAAAFAAYNGFLIYKVERKKWPRPTEEKKDSTKNNKELFSILKKEH